MPLTLLATLKVQSSSLLFAAKGERLDEKYPADPLKSVRQAVLL
jgi:hypothetical protein